MKLKTSLVFGLLNTITILTAQNHIGVEFPAERTVNSNDNLMNINSDIVNPTNSWSILEYGLVLGQNSIGMPENKICCISTKQIKIIGDSVLDGKSYKKVYSNKPTQQLIYEGLIREIDQKVFFVFANKVIEELLYDFNVQDANQVTFFQPTTKSLRTLYVRVDSVSINGTAKKRIRLSDVPNETKYFIDTWIQGIGSLNGLLYAGSTLLGGGKSLLCLSQEESFIYQNPLLSKCSYSNDDLIIVGAALGFPAVTGLSENKYNDISFEIRADRLIVYSENEIITKIDIFNSEGINLYSAKYNSSRSETRLSFLTNGPYFAKIYRNNGRVDNFKFIKK